MGKQYNHYSKEQIEYIRAIAEGNPVKEITKQLNEKFGINKTVRSVRNVMSRNQIKNNMQGYATRFEKGQESWNKGTKGLTNGSSTSFKKGNIPPMTREVGHETILEGMIYIKIAQPNVWKLKSRHIWEQAHGTIPENHKILFRDNNKLNVELDNLFMVKDSVMKSVSKRKLRHEDPEVNYSTHLLAELELMVKEKA